jgi:phage shock protein PspC (stress-responsive transcriptional regulator)
MNKQLYKSNRNKLIAGVAGGLGEYFDVDPIIIRIIFFVSIFAWGLSFYIYVIMWIFVPSNPEEFDSIFPETDIDSSKEILSQDDENTKIHRRIVAGVILILFGSIILINKYIPEIEIFNLWPLMLIILGIYVIYKAQQRRGRSII